MENNKNYTPITVGMLWALNRVIWALFSTFPAPVVPGPEESSKLDRKCFQRTTRNDKIAPQKVSVCFECKTESSGPDFHLWVLLWYPAMEKSSKFNRNIFELYWLKTICTAPQIVCVCFGCKTESSGTGFQLYLLQWGSCWKSRQNSTKTITTAPQNFSMSRVQNRVIRAQLST